MLSTDTHVMLEVIENASSPRWLPPMSMESYVFHVLTDLLGENRESIDGI